jgi:glycosyltransferase involved in cell wall biosynthesis
LEVVVYPRNKEKAMFGPVIGFCRGIFAGASPAQKQELRKLKRIRHTAKTLRAVPRPGRDGSSAEPYILMATFRSTIGLGQSARRLAIALRDAGHVVYTIDVTDLFGLPAVVPWTSAPPPAGSAGTLVICLQPPTLHRIVRARGIGDFLGRRWVGYWWWELERLPDSWSEIASQVDELWCSSQFVYDCFARSIPGKPIRFVPLAIEDPEPSGRTLQDFGLPIDKFTVLSVFDLRSHTARKNPEGMIAAFRKAFGTRSDVLYVLKVAGAAKYPQDLERLRHEIAQSPNIVVLEESLSNEDLYALVKHSCVLLSLHRSEGLGMVLAEAALLGTPIVATGWSGVLDFLDSDCAGLVGYELVPVERLDNLPAPQGSVWAEPDVAEAALWLQRLEADRALGRLMAARAHGRAKTVFSQSRFEEQFAAMGGGSAMPSAR